MQVRGQLHASTALSAVKSAPDPITAVCIAPAKNRNSIQRISRLYRSQYTEWTTQHLINVPVWNICNTFSKSCIAVMLTDLVPGADLIVFPHVHYLLVHLLLIIPTCGFSVQHIHRIIQQQSYTGGFARPSCQMQRTSALRVQDPERGSVFKEQQDDLTVAGDSRQVASGISQWPTGCVCTCPTF